MRSGTSRRLAGMVTLWLATTGPKFGRSGDLVADEQDHSLRLVRLALHVEYGRMHERLAQPVDRLVQFARQPQRLPTRALLQLEILQLELDLGLPQLGPPPLLGGAVVAVVVIAAADVDNYRLEVLDFVVVGSPELVDGALGRPGG